MKLLVKLSLRKRSIYDNPNALDIRLVINYPRPIRRAKEPNMSRTMLIIKR
jgi:hypothetical protein